MSWVALRASVSSSVTSPGWLGPSGWVWTCSLSCKELWQPRDYLITPLSLGQHPHPQLLQKLSLMGPVSFPCHHISLRPQVTTSHRFAVPESWLPCLPCVLLHLGPACSSRLTPRLHYLTGTHGRCLLGVAPGTGDVRRSGGWDSASPALRTTT